MTRGTFFGLALDNYEYDLGNALSGGIGRGNEFLELCFTDGNFSVSATNCNITISNYDLITRFAPYCGWLNYTVEGQGTQRFTLHYLSSDGGWYGPDLWTVYLDSVLKPQNEGWQISKSPERTITVSGALKKVSIFYGRTPVIREDMPEVDSFSSTLQFIIGFTVMLAPLMLIITIVIVALVLVLNRKRKLKQKKITQNK